MPIWVPASQVLRSTEYSVLQKTAATWDEVWMEQTLAFPKIIDLTCLGFVKFKVITFV